MAPGRYRFDRFLLDQGDRLLCRDDVPVELAGRYLDALALLVRERGKLVSKDRFMDEVWRGVPVTDEALTQCIRTLRRQLGDSATSPRFIETVPKHGYRFIAPVDAVGDRPAPGAPPAKAPTAAWRQVLRLGGAGTLGGGGGGLIGGVAYGFAGAAQPLPGVGAASVLIVLVCLSVAVALVGAAGVSVGIATAGLARAPAWRIVGGLAGGLVVAAVAKLLGTDAFELLFGQSPGDIAGAAEGALLGGAVGLGAWLGDGGSPRRAILAAAAAGGIGGVGIGLIGGRLMGGSLDLLARHFVHSRLRLDGIGGWLGETGFGPVSRVVTGGIEGALFGGCIMAGFVVARRRR